MVRVTVVPCVGEMFSESRIDARRVKETERVTYGETGQRLEDTVASRIRACAVGLWGGGLRRVGSIGLRTRGGS